MNAATKEGFVMNTLRRIPRVLTKAIAAGAVMVAAALPVAVMGAGTASAATTNPSLFCSQNDLISAGGQYNYAGSPYCGSMPWGAQNQVISFNVFGSNFAFDNGPASATTTATGVTVLSVTENTTYSATVTLAIGAATAPGYYGLTLTDDNGSGSLATAFGLSGYPTHYDKKYLSRTTSRSLSGI